LDLEFEHGVYRLEKCAGGYQIRIDYSDGRYRVWTFADNPRAVATFLSSNMIVSCWYRLKFGIQNHKGFLPIVSRISNGKEEDFNWLTEMLENNVILFSNLYETFGN